MSQPVNCLVCHQPLFHELLVQKDKPAFRRKYFSQIMQYENARKYLKNLYPSEVFPSIQTVRFQNNHLKEYLLDNIILNG